MLRVDSYCHICCIENCYYRVGSLSRKLLDMKESSKQKAFANDMKEILYIEIVSHLMGDMNEIKTMIDCKCIPDHQKEKPSSK